MWQLPATVAGKAIPWKWIGIGLAALAIVATVFLSIRAYGNSRYDAGVTDTDAAWKAAAEALEQASEDSAEQADENAAPREQGFAQALEEEKEKIDAAVDAGDDVFDVMFDTFGVSDDTGSDEPTP